jgi:CD109 antigen
LQEVECRIYGRSLTGRNVEIRQNTRVPPGETQLVRMTIGELGEGNYRFEAKGVAPMQFQDSTPLQYFHKGYSVFIQTDKAIYRPGNKVGEQTYLNQ